MDGYIIKVPDYKRLAERFQKGYKIIIKRDITLFSLEFGSKIIGISRFITIL